MEEILNSTNLYYVRVNSKLLNDYLEMVNDYEKVSRFISHKKKTYTIENEIEWIEEQKDNKLIFSIIEKETNLFVGNIELMDKKLNMEYLDFILEQLSELDDITYRAIPTMQKWLQNLLQQRSLSITEKCLP